MITEDEIMSIVRGYLVTPEGKKFLKDNKVKAFGYSKDDVRRICKELRAALIDAYFSILSPEASTQQMREADVEVFMSPEGSFYDVGNRKRGKRLAALVFTQRALRRNSLYYESYRRGGRIHTKHGTAYLRGKTTKGWTGAAYRKNSPYPERYAGSGESTGVYDIFGLLTQGYTISGRVPVGQWHSENIAFEVLGSQDYGDHIPARPKREGNPFVAGVVKTFEARYPGLKIEFPELWGGSLPYGASLDVSGDVPFY